jgi:hypothetical protein
MPQEKTLSDLRNACKPYGIKVKKQTLSWGPHISFLIDGCPISSSTVISTAFFEKNRAAFGALQKIKSEFQGLMVDGQKAYGIS